MTSDSEGFDRRPLASLDTRWARSLTGVLVRRGATPNGISTFGMAAGVTAGALFALTAWTEDGLRRVLWVAGAGCVQLRLLSNLLDGMVAVASRRISKLGELFNEFPDRVSDTATLIGLGYAAGGVAELGFLAACAALLTAYVRALAKTVGVPGVYAGPMAKPHRMAVVTVAAVACAILPPGWDEAYRIPGWAAGICLGGALVTVVRRLMITAGHLRNNRP